MVVPRHPYEAPLDPEMTDDEFLEYLRDGYQLKQLSVIHERINLIQDAQIREEAWRIFLRSSRQ